VSITTQEEAGTAISLDARQHRPGYYGLIRKIGQRTKWAKQSGRLARETLIIDRSAPGKTVEEHRVEERQPDGSWELVHEHVKEFDARRRPKD
jgi:hypothetical protein